MVYVRLALRRPPNPVTETAKQRLAKLQAEARKKFEELDRSLADGGQPAAGPSRAGSDGAGPAAAGPKKGSGTVEAPDKAAGSDEAETPENGADDADRPAEQQGETPAGEDGRIFAVFREYDRLINKYGELPVVGPEIKAHVAKLRHQPEYAVILNEPAATFLWKQGRQYERDNHLCCAYWTYKQAAELLPAPSAVLASDRFAELAKDPKVVASAAACRELKWCHQAYLRAERLLKVRPESAKEIFAEIVRRAGGQRGLSRRQRAHSVTRPGDHFGTQHAV